MDTVRCPYCESKVRLAEVEAEDGECPECGAPITGSLLFATDEDAEDELFDEDEEKEDDLELDDDDEFQDYDE